MSNKVDLVPLIEWAIKRNGPEITRTRKVKDNPFEILELKRRELQQWEQWVKDIEKLNKKEEKLNTWWGKLSTPQLAMMMIVLVPVYMAVLQKVIH